MDIKQISVFLENKPGYMLSMTKVLAEKNIDMRALSLAEASDFGIVRFIPDDIYNASTVLKEAGFVCSISSALCVRIPNKAGGLNSVLEVLANANVNLEYMYACNGAKAHTHAYMILHVQEPKAAAAALRAKGIRLLDQEELAAL